MRTWTCHKHVQSLLSNPSGGHRMGGSVTISPPQTRAVNIFFANAGRFCNRNSRQNKHKLSPRWSDQSGMLSTSLQLFWASPMSDGYSDLNWRNLPSSIHLHSVLNLTLTNRTLAQWLAHCASGPVTGAIVGSNPTWDRLKDHFFSCSESTLARSHQGLQNMQNIVFLCKTNPSRNSSNPNTKKSRSAWQPAVRTYQLWQLPGRAGWHRTRSVGVHCLWPFPAALLVSHHSFVSRVHHILQLSIMLWKVMQNKMDLFSFLFFVVMIFLVRQRKTLHDKHADT